MALSLSITAKAKQMGDKKVWSVIKNGKIIKVTFSDDQPQPAKEEKELDWFRLYQPEVVNENENLH